MVKDDNKNGEEAPRKVTFDISRLYPTIRHGNEEFTSQAGSMHVARDLRKELEADKDIEPSEFARSIVAKSLLPADSQDPVGDARAYQLIGEEGFLEKFIEAHPEFFSEYHRNEPDGKARWKRVLERKEEEAASEFLLRAYRDHQERSVKRWKETNDRLMKQYGGLTSVLGGSGLDNVMKQKRLLDDALGGSAQRFFREEQERRKLLNQVAMGQAAKEIYDRQKEREQLLQPFKNDTFQKYFDAENARRRAFDVGTLASARAFQDNIATVIEALVGPTQKLSEQMRELGLLDRIAEQQSALVKASMGINSQMEATRRAMRDAIPTASQIAASLGVQSTLAESMRRISAQVSQFDRIALTGEIRGSAVWEAMRDTYDLSDEMSVSQAFLEIGTKLAQPSERGKSFGFSDAWQLLQFLWLVFTAYAMIAGWGDYTEEDRARDEGTAETVERLEARQRMKDVEAAIAEASALAEMARINELPRAYVGDSANVRVAPNQKAERVARLGQNTMLAIEEKKGRWLRVIYADTLTEELAEGWVWGSSVELMSEN